MNKSFFPVYLVFACLFGGLDTRKLNCPLKWEPYTGTGLSSLAVPASKYTLDNYIIRVGSEENGYVAGNLQVKLGFALAPNSTDPGQVATYSDNYEVLTNPFECVLSWELEPNEYSVRLGSGYVGRAPLEGNILAGHLENDVIEIATIDKEMVSINKDFQYISSFLTGLKMEAGNVTLIHDEIVPTFEFVGMDEIHNPSPATVKQLIEHKSRSFESLTVKTWRSWYSASRFDFNIGLSFAIPIWPPYVAINTDVGIGIHVESDDAGYDSSTVHRETEQEIVVGRELTVLPYTSIQACSLIIKIKDFKATYESEDRYYAPGFSGTEVNGLLTEAGIVGGTIDGDSVFVKNSGDVAANIFLTTKFIVKEYDPSGVNDCGNLPTSFAEFEDFDPKMVSKCKNKSCNKHLALSKLFK